MDFLTIIQVLDSALRSATPLLFACLAGLMSERAGIFDIGLEGKMLMAAFMAASVAYLTFHAETWGIGIPFTDLVIPLTWLKDILPAAGWGLLAGIAASIVLSLIHGVASITFRGNQLISGVAINFLAIGLTVVVGKDWFNQGGRTPQLEGSARFLSQDWPGAEALKDTAIIGPIYSELISGHAITVYLGLLTVPLVWWVLFRTRFGLRLRAVGENPESVDTSGVSVIRLRYIAVIICGMLCGIAGTHLAISEPAAGFVKEMSAGRGFIALAALIFAKWRPGAALMACLLFGLLDAIANRYQNIDVPSWLLLGFVLAAAAGFIYAGRKSRLDMAVLGSLGALLLILGVAILWTTGLGGNATLPVQFMQALPYILTVVILAGFVGKAIPPRAGGEPYVKER